jgi:hypothetical protein
MMTRLSIVHAFVLALAGCSGGGGGILLVTVDATGRVPSVDSLRVTVSSGGQTASPVAVKLQGGPADIPPERTFSLSFTPDRSGAVHVAVDALGLDSRTIASAGGDGTITPGAETTATVTLPGVAVVEDMGGADLAGRDSGLDAGGDMRVPPDFARPDLLALPDLTTTTVPDLIVPDLLPACACVPNGKQQGSCDACSEQMCGGDCQWGTCQLLPGSACRDGEGRSCQNPGVCSSSQTCTNCQWPTYCCG